MSMRAMAAPFLAAPLITVERLRPLASFLLMPVPIQQAAVRLPSAWMRSGMAALIVINQTPPAAGPHGRDGAGACWWRCPRRTLVLCDECGQPSAAGWLEEACGGLRRYVCTAMGCFSTAAICRRIPFRRSMRRRRATLDQRPGRTSSGEKRTPRAIPVRALATESQNSVARARKETLFVARLLEPVMMGGQARERSMRLWSSRSVLRDVFDTWVSARRVTPLRGAREIIPTSLRVRGSFIANRVWGRNPRR
jgi:hypothetical protein